MLCLHRDTTALIERLIRSKNNDGLADRGRPVDVYITGWMPKTGSGVLYFPCWCHGLPACHSAGRSVFILCTSCVFSNQPNWVLGISLIPNEWLYFLSAHTHKHRFKRHHFSETLSFVSAAFFHDASSAHVINVGHSSKRTKRQRNPYFSFKIWVCLHALSNKYWQKHEISKGTENLVSSYMLKD